MRCTNCGHAGVEAYCPRCGQRSRRDRLRVRSVLRQAADDAVNLDRGLLHTVLALSRRPGPTVADYVGGRTQPYTNPAKYLVVWAAVATFTFFYSGLIDAQFEMLTREAVRDDVEVATPDVEEAAAAILDVMRRYFNLLLIAGVPFMAVSSRLVFARSRYNLAEHLVFNTYVYAHQNVLFVVALPFYLLAGDAMLQLAVWSSAAVLYYVWACRGFFEVGWGTAALRGVLITVLAYAVIWILSGAALVIIVGVGRG